MLTKSGVPFALSVKLSADTIDNERLKEIRVRKKHETKKMKALEIAETRIHEIEKEIERLLL